MAKRFTLPSTELDTSIICNVLDGVIRPHDLACVVKTVDENNIYLRVDEKPDGTKILGVWRDDSGVVDVQLESDLVCNIEEGVLYCQTKAGDTVVDIRKLTNGSLRVDVLSPKVNYFDYIT